VASETRLNSRNAGVPVTALRWMVSPLPTIVRSLPATTVGSPVAPYVSLFTAPSVNVVPGVSVIVFAPPAALAALMSLTSSETDAAVNAVRRRRDSSRSIGCMGISSCSANAPYAPNAALFHGRWSVIESLNRKTKLPWSSRKVTSSVKLPDAPAKRPVPPR
jgi:hypothetical protein